MPDKNDVAACLIKRIIIKNAVALGWHVFQYDNKIILTKDRCDMDEVDKNNNSLIAYLIDTNRYDVFNQ